MLYFIRHALDDEAYVGSWSSVPILESEVEKVKRQADFIKQNYKISQIITSDILRAKQTADIINETINVPIFEDINLREQNKGTLSGKLKSRLTPEEKELITNQTINTTFPNGESLLDLYKRIRNYLKVIDTFEDNTLIVTHRGVINIIYYILNDIPLDMEKGRFNVDHISLHEYDKGKKLIRRLK